MFVKIVEEDHEEKTHFNVRDVGKHADINTAFKGKIQKNLVITSLKQALFKPDLKKDTENNKDKVNPTTGLSSNLEKLLKDEVENPKVKSSDLTDIFSNARDPNEQV